MKNSFWLILPALLLLSACGLSGNRTSDPGYADHHLPDWNESVRVASISLDPAILGLVKWSVENPEEEFLLDLFVDLRAIRIAVCV